MNRTSVISATGGPRRSFPSLTRLARVPNPFTVPSDVILGAVLVSGGRPAVPLLSLVGTVLVSVLLYATGTMLSDYADADEDARLRLERPIPSGDVSHTRAGNLGLALPGAGVVVAAAVEGLIARIVAAVLGSFIALYDGALKGTSPGFAATGGCRGASVAPGMAVAAGSPSAPMVLTLSAWAFFMSVVVASYIAGVTYMAERETGAGDLRAVLVGMAGVGPAAGLVVVAGAVVGVGPSDTATVVVAGGLLCWLAAWTGRNFLTVYADPRPSIIGLAVGAYALDLVVLSGALSGLLMPVWGVVTAASVVPAVSPLSALDVP